MIKLTKKELHRVLRVEKDKIMWNTTSKKNKCAECYRNGHKCIKYLGTNYKYDNMYKALTNEFFNITEDSVFDYTINYNLSTNNDFISHAISQLNNKFKYDSLTNKFFAIKQENELRLITIDSIDYIYLVHSFFPANKVLDMWKANGMSVKNFKTYTIEPTKNTEFITITNNTESVTTTNNTFNSVVEEYIEIDKYCALNLLTEFKKEIKIISKKDNGAIQHLRLVGIDLSNKEPFIVYGYNTEKYYHKYNVDKLFIKNLNSIINNYTYNNIVNMVTKINE